MRLFANDASISGHNSPKVRIFYVVGKDFGKIDIISVVYRKIAAQPSHCALLAVQFLFNWFSYVYGLVVECAVVFYFCHINCIFLTLAYNLPMLSAQNGC